MEKKIIFTILMVFLLAFSLGCTKEEPIDQTNGTNDDSNEDNDITCAVDCPVGYKPSGDCGCAACENECPAGEQFIFGCQCGVPSHETTVTIEYFAYNPNIIHISTGDTVVFENEDGDVKHQIVSGPVENFRSKPDGLFESVELSEGDTWEYTFEEAGEYPFHSPKYTKMQGLVIVDWDKHDVISITTPHFVGSTPTHLKELSSLDEIWITFNIPISNTSKISVYNVDMDHDMELSIAEVDSSNNLRLHAEFAEPLTAALYKVSYTEVIPEGTYDGQFFFYIEE